MPAPTTPHRRRPRLCSLAALGALALLAAGCAGPGDGAAPDAAEEAPLDAPETAASDDEAARAAPPPPMLPQTPLPSDHGLFQVEQGESLSALPAGDPDSVHPSNAERGFGFTRPQGPALTETRPLFVLWSGSLELATLRLTRFAPESLLPPRWWEAGEPGRSGWLPHSFVRLVVEPVAGQPGMVRLQPAEALAPGFYVLHDGALLRGRQRKDLTAFFAFEVAAAHDAALAGEALWLTRASGCLREVENLFVVDAHVFDPPVEGRPRTARFDREGLARTHAARLAHCARQLQTVLVASREPEVRERARAALLALSVIARGVPFDAIHDVLEATDPRFASAPLLAYWLEHEALAAALEVRRALADGKLDSAGGLAAKLAALYGDWRTTATLEDARDGALGRLLWIPWFVDARWPRLLGFATRITTGDAPWDEAAVLLAAHRANRLQRFASRYPESPLASVADASWRGLPPDVLLAASELDASPAADPTQRVQIGAAHVALTTSDDLALKERTERWLRGATRQIARCHEALESRVGQSRQGVVLVQIELEQSYFGGQARVVALEPPTPGGSVAERMGDTEFTTCLQANALGEVPTTLSTESTRVVVPIAFGSEDALRKRLR